MLTTVTSGMEFLNSKYDPLGVALDGWSEQVNENIEDYDEIFEELYDKYKDKSKVAPEVRLVMSLGLSAAMCHVTNTMFKQKMPGMDDILKRNPELARQMARAAAEQAKAMAAGGAQPQAYGRGLDVAEGGAWLDDRVHGREVGVDGPGVGEGAEPGGHGVVVGQRRGRGGGDGELREGQRGEGVSEGRVRRGQEARLGVGRVRVADPGEEGGAAFGREKAPIVFGWVFTAHQLGGAVAALGAGWSRDALASYLPAFALAGAACLIAAALALGARRRAEPAAV
jgi:hypothetical protein